MYFLFNQLRISKSELESKLGKGLKDRFAGTVLSAARSSMAHALTPEIFLFRSRFSVVRELLKGLPYRNETMTAWHPNWLLLIEMMVSFTCNQFFIPGIRFR
jgi:hypothetical protein